ncbi:hypothetical protein L9F63_018699 [Diploptera punctata]|uniref:Inter-alpha-trypsin inhibitor heavy chain H4-like n=1 Tax=Diploptera punctata TaxID=6984 RepID=A0AAD7ZWB4_DIPPU|nr:hypothetical protein L9F63_018699 [Diploptera punctata]
MQVLTLFVVLLCYRSAAASLIIVPEPVQQSTAVSQDAAEAAVKPYMHYFHVESDIKYRYAKTLATTRIENPANVAQEVSFTAVLPDTAYISGFNMEVDGKVYVAYVKEKEAAQKEYDDAVEHGQTAGQVVQTARDSNRFTVSVNVESNKEVIFNLTYEELLTRRLELYSDVINLNPGQVVNDFSVTVNIEESSNIRSLRVPALKVDEEKSVEGTTNALASIEMTSPTTAVVKFTPTPTEQQNVSADGIIGQFIVEYDVDRTSDGGEVLVNDGYFVHFFSPENLKPLKKHVTFVLDLSGSMMGRPIEQLREAMLTILDDLNSGDFFSIVLFSQTAQVWDPTISDDEMDQRLALVGSYTYNQEGFPLPAATPSVIVKVTDKHIQKAKTFINKLQATASTDIYDGLLLGLNIANLNPKKLQNQPNGKQPEPIIIFLTDGLPNVHIYDPDTIVSDITKANTKDASIYSLALGYSADYDFLKKLSLKNSGFSRRIYEAADTALQLTDFYKEISSPLLADVEFEYTPDQVEDGTLTTRVFRRLFAGSELVVAGKLREEIDINLTGGVTAISINGTITYTFEAIIIQYPPIDIPPPATHTPSNMERLWAYLTIQQLLDEDAVLDYDHNNKNLTSPQKQQALELALDYSFVTSLTSLVVVKPNETNAVDPHDAGQADSYGDGGINAGVGGSVGSEDRYDGGGDIPGDAGDGGEAGEGPGEAGDGGDGGEGPSDGGDGPGEGGDDGEAASVCLKQLDDIAWLPQNHSLVLEQDTLEAAGVSEIDQQFSECLTPSGDNGYCRHLEYCVLSTFTDKLEDFIPYKCDAGGYLGVCCPVTAIPNC